MLLLALLNYYSIYFYYPSLKLRPSYDVLELAPSILIGPFLNEDKMDFEAICYYA